MPLILIEAPSSAYHRGRLSLENNHAHEEETSGASTLNSTHFIGVSPCTLVPWTSVCCTTMEQSLGTARGPQAPSPCSRPWHPTGRSWSSLCRLPLSLGLAGRPLGTRRDALCPRPCLVHESQPRRQGPQRHHRLAAH